MAAMRERHLKGGYVLVEVVALLAVLLVVIGLLLPVAGKVRHEARIDTCMGNMRDISLAMTGYLADHGNVYPGGVYDGNGDGVSYEIRWHNLLGVKGTTIWGKRRGAPGYTPESDRPLNPYLSDPRRSATCPLDVGGRERFGSVAQLQGCSYFYFDRPTHLIASGKRVGRYGVWAVEGHRTSEIEQPEKKLVTADFMILADKSMDVSDNRWHGIFDPVEVSILFADGHAGQIERKLSDEMNPEQIRVLPMELIERWRVETNYY